MRRDVFQAIADPTRREIMDKLSHSRMKINELAESFEISRPAVSKHIRILRECGLVRVERRGRERVCEAQFEKLGEVALWVHQYKRFWNERLDQLEYLINVEAKNKNNG